MLILICEHWTIRKCLGNFFVLGHLQNHSKNHPNPSQNRPKTLPKSIQIRGSRKDAKFHRFCSNFVACCKSRPSKFVRPANVLLTFHTIHLLTFSTYLGSEKPSKNPRKTMPEPFQNRCQKRVVFQHRFFRVWGSILEPLGLPRWSQLSVLGSQDAPKSPQNPVIWEHVSKIPSKKLCGVSKKDPKECPEVDFGRIFQ